MYAATNRKQGFSRQAAPVQESGKDKIARFVRYCEAHGKGEAVKAFTVCQTTCEGCPVAAKCPLLNVEAAPAPAPVQVVDAELRTFLVDSLNAQRRNQDDGVKNAYSKYVSAGRGVESVAFTSNAKPLTHKTIFGMIQTGITCRNAAFSVKSFESCLKVKDYAAQMAALKRLYALTVIFSGALRLQYGRVEAVNQDVVEMVVADKFRIYQATKHN